MVRPAARGAKASTSWLFGATRDRLRSQWRLLLAVIAVAVLANTLITSLGLLVTATESQGARGSLAAIPVEQTVIHVRLVDLTGTVEGADAGVSAAVKTALGKSVALSSVGMALTDVGPLIDDLPVPGYAYFGQLDEVQSHSRLVKGEWATLGSGDVVPVTVPEAAATAIGLSVGSTFAVEVGDNMTTVQVVGIYAGDVKDEDYWALDPLRGKGNDAAYPQPGVNFYRPVEALGPLVVPAGALAQADIPVSSLQFSFYPDFSGVAVDDLAPLMDRLATADVDVRIDSGRVSERLLYTSDVAPVIASVTSGLVVTRATVVVVSLLLLVLAIAAMAQTARLFSDSRIGERRLMRSRGASSWHILALTAVEAVLIGIVTATVSPLLAALTYRLIAAQPAMVAAGMPSTVAISALAWGTAAAVSLAFIVVLVAPLIGRARAIAEDDHATARPRRASGLMRSGVDLALVVLAGLAYWQLVSYHGVVDTTTSLTIDPVLAVGPALVLLAGALLCVRLIPAASYLVERGGSRSNRVVLPLASWELGRRPTRAVAAVLLLSLALAVGTFGLSFLSTWRQSQLDQAAVAVGAPVRVSADPDTDAITEQAEKLASDMEGTPGPVFRRFGLLDVGLDDSGQGGNGASVQVLGLSESARELINRGRLAEVGGHQIALLLRTPITPSVGIDLPAGARYLSASARLTEPAGELDDSLATLRGVIEDADHLITTVDLGQIPADGEAYQLGGELPVGTGLRLVGIQTAFDGNFGVGSSELPTADATIDIGGLSAAGTALATPASDAWFPVNADPVGERVRLADAPAGWQFRLGVAVPAGRASAFTLVGWKPQPAIMAVVPKELQQRYQLQAGSLLTLTTQSTAVPLQLGSAAQLIPGAAAAEELDATSNGLGAGAARASTIVVDQESLARVLAQGGVAGPMVDEWWLDVPVGAGQAYVSSHPIEKDAPPVYSSDVLGAQLQQAPLRVATQAALWVSIVAGALLAAVGFAMHSVATLRARRVELAQLRAIGLTRRGLLALVGAESLLLCVLGIVFGVSIGVLLAFLVGPLVAVSPDGTPPVPSIIVDIPLQSIALLALEMVAVLAIVVLVVARAQRYTQPADLLRGGVEP